MKVFAGGDGKNWRCSFLATLGTRNALVLTKKTMTTTEASSDRRVLRANGENRADWAVESMLLPDLYRQQLR